MKLSLNKLVAAGAVAVVLMTSATAMARHDDRDWRYHERHARQWHVVHPHYVPHYVATSPIYAPPVIVAPPPPPPSGINLIVPLNFR